MVKKWFKYYILKESLKEIELNRILDKIYRNNILTTREMNFLNLYNQTNDSDLKDYLYLSRDLACDKINIFLKQKKKIWCNLTDKNGKIGDLIINIDNHKLILKHSEYIMEDRFLYNIEYDIRKNEYSLKEQDEYFEKIETIKRND